MLSRVIRQTAASPFSASFHSRRAMSLVGLALVTACTASTGSGGETTGAEESALLVKLPYVTAAGPHGLTNINVCWDTPGNDMLKATMQHGVEDAWQRFTNVQFSGWGPCLPPNLSNLFPSIRISLTSGTGSPYTTPDRTEIHIFDPGNDAPYMVSTLIHELGHVLGFMHEQLRPNGGAVAAACYASPAALDKNFWQSKDDTGDTRGYGGWDLFSIMNYCQPHYADRAVDALDHLGPSDVYGGQKTYGAKPKGSLVTAGGKCLNVPNARLDASTRLETHDCWTDAPSETWSFDFSRGALRTLLPTPNAPNGICADTQGAGPATMGTMGADSCVGDSDQTFYLTHALILYQGLCFTRTPLNGKTIVNLELCQQGEAAQEWQIHSTGEITDPTSSFTSTNLTGHVCLDPQWANNAPLAALPCDGTHRQQWTIQDGGPLQVLENKCVTVPGDYDAAHPTISSPMLEATGLGVTACSATAVGQKFSLSGFLQNGPKSCFHPANGWVASGLPFQAAACTLDRTERVDYYPAGQYSVLPRVATVLIDSPLNQSHGPYGLSNQVHFQGSVLHMGDASKLKITWTSNVDGGIGNSLSFNYGFATPGVRTITLRVEDPNGVVATRTVTYDADAVPPGAAIFEPLDGAQEKLNQPFNLRGNGSTPATLALPCDHLEWRFDLVPSWSSTGCTASPSFDVVGTGTLSLHVRDDSGLTAVASRRVSIVDPGPQLSPWASISEPTVKRISVANTTRLVGTGGDPAGQQVAYRWEAVDPTSGRELLIGNAAALDWLPSSTLPWPSCGYTVDLRFYVSASDGRAGMSDTQVYINCIAQ